MKMAKKVLAVVMAIAMLAAFSSVSMVVSAEDAKDSVEGIRWFPADMTRNGGYDDMWEVEVAADGGLVCQRFNEADQNPDAQDALLDTTYDENGALTISRNANGDQDPYWPRIRTLYLENMPAIDLSTANTLYFDFTATESWMIALDFNGSLELKLAKAICEAAGTANLGSTDEDGVAGTYKGSINLNDVINGIATSAADPHKTEMSALQSMKKIFVPMAQIFVVGSRSASMTINSLYISSADDPTGEKCDLMDMGLVYGDDFYDTDDAPATDDASADDKDEEPADDKDDAAENTTTTTKAAANNTGGGVNIWVIVGIVAAVVVVAVVVVIVVTKGKKKGA
ncbi:MAG: hypothetical protein IJU16_04685 [Clostridia bacterium]|nr:hypothetical protein [Clostridia bacterium]